MSITLSDEKEKFLAQVQDTLPPYLLSQIREKVEKLPDRVEIYVSMSKTQDILAFIELFEAFCRGKKQEPQFELLNAYCLGLIMLGVSTLLTTVGGKNEPKT